MENILCIIAAITTSANTTSEEAIDPQLSSLLSPVPDLVPRIVLRDGAKVARWHQKMAARF